MSAPVSRRCVANEWRREWLLTRLPSPAATAASLIARLHDRLVHVMPATHACGVHEGARGREDIAPSPLAGRARVLALQGLAQRRDVHAISPVGAVLKLAVGEPPPESGGTAVRQRGPPILSALSRPHDDLPAVQIHVLDAKRHALGHAKSATVHQRRAEASGIAQPAEQRAHLAL
jgi:hypothetical protein